MTTETTATVIGGSLHLDEPLNLPDQTRVRVTVVATGDERQRRLEAWKKLQEYMRTHPLNSGGLRFTRDQLHDRI